MANELIKNTAKNKRVAQWEIADFMGIHESKFARMLRRELEPKETEKILDIINLLAGLNADAEEDEKELSFSYEEVTQVVSNVMFAFLTWLEGVGKNKDHAPTDKDMDRLTEATSVLISGGWAELDGSDDDFEKLVNHKGE